MLSAQVCHLRGKSIGITIMGTKRAAKGLQNPPYWEYSCETLAGTKQ